MKYRINLLPDKEQTVVDRAIFFSFHYLRYILVLTQLVVICVFMYRFNVDQEIVDTKDTLRQKQEIITVSKPLLTEGEQMFQRTENIVKIIKNQNSSSQMLDYTLSRFPEQFSLTSLEMDGLNLKFEGITADANIIKSYYSRLQKERKFTKVELSNIERNETGFTFSFVLTGFL